MEAKIKEIINNSDDIKTKATNFMELMDEMRDHIPEGMYLEAVNCLKELYINEDIDEDEDEEEQRPTQTIQYYAEVYNDVVEDIEFYVTNMDNPSDSNGSDLLETIQSWDQLPAFRPDIIIPYRDREDIMTDEKRREIIREKEAIARSLAY